MNYLPVRLRGGRLHEKISHKLFKYLPSKKQEARSKKQELKKRLCSTSSKMYIYLF